MTVALVTGGAGFIGSHLVDALLAEDISVRVVDNYSTGRPENLAHVSGKVEIIEADIAKSGSWQKSIQGADWVFHLGALADIVPSIQRPEDYFLANVNGTFNVLEAARNAGVKRFIYAASSSCYGIPESYPTAETAEISPQYPYALTKRLGEELVMHWARLYNLPAIALRLFNVYGPRSRTSGTYGAVFGVFLAQKLAGKPFTVVGDGTQTRDFTYVTDVASAFLTAAKSSSYAEIYNVGSGETVSVNRLVELLGGEVTYIPKRPGEPDCTYADITKIRRELKWQPKVNIKHGVDNVLANIDYWKSAPVWTPATIAVATQDWFKYLGENDR